MTIAVLLNQIQIKQKYISRYLLKKWSIVKRDKERLYYRIWNISIEGSLLINFVAQI